MKPTTETARFARFGPVAFNRATGELASEGQTQALPPTVARLLALLLERAGNAVPRAELWAFVWPDDRIDLDQKLNFCVYRLRDLLGDSARQPRYLQTVPRTGYRWVGPVEWGTGSWQEAVTATCSVPEPAPMSRVRWTRARAVAGVGLAVAGGLLGLFATRGAPGGVVQAPGGADTREALAVGRAILSADDGDLELAQQHLEYAASDPALRAAALASLAAVEEERGDAEGARRLLHRALAADSMEGTAHLRLGAHALFAEWDLRGAEFHLLRAAHTDAVRADAARLLGHTYVAMGRHEQARRWADELRALAPVHALRQADAGWLSYWTGDPHRAIEACETSQRLVGRTHLNDACLFSAHLMVGDTARAASVALADTDWPHPRRAVESAEVVRTYLNARLQSFSDESEWAYARARTLGMLGRTDEALEALQEAAGARHVGLLYAASDPVFAPLRAREPFKRLTRWVRDDAELRPAAGPTAAAGRAGDYRRGS